MSYTHLTEDERYQIKEWLDEGKSQAFMARKLDRSPSTISRELSRNRGERGYRPRQAQLKAEERKQLNHGMPRIDTAVWTEVEAQLRLDLSPEQIVGSRELAEKPTPSHERIYQHIYEDKANGGTLYTHLRCKRKRRKRYAGGRDKRGQIRNRRSISERPKVVEKRARVGDWEADTILGKQESMAIVTVVERKTGYLVARKVKQRKAEQVRNAIVVELASYEKFVKTITFDNGKEFAEHETIAEALNAETFFAAPYASWQRGSNENTNGLLRQYIPKSMSLDALSNYELQCIVERINNRPRKRLGWRSPYQLFHAAIDEHGVALPC